MAVILGDKLALSLLGISDLRRHEFQPFIKLRLSQKVAVNLAIGPKRTAYQADILKFGNKCTKTGTDPILDSLGNAGRHFLWMDSEKQAPTELGNELQLI